MLALHDAIDGRRGSRAARGHLAAAKAAVAEYFAGHAARATASRAGTSCPTSTSAAPRGGSHSASSSAAERRSFPATKTFADNGHFLTPSVDPGMHAYRSAFPLAGLG